MSAKKRTVLGVDPGDVFSALVTWDGEKLLNAARVENDAAIQLITASDCTDFAIERIVLWNKAGKSVSETIEWAGRFKQAAIFMGMDTHWLYRKTIAAHMTGLAKYGDKQIRASLIKRFGPPPTKGCPNCVYNGCKIPDKKNDRWAAWAVAVTWWDKHCGGMI